jgi:predicted oxidoreductase
MTEDAPDTTTMSGAQFQRAVGTDPAKWAEAFVRSTAGEMREAEILERASWVTPWFRDYAEVRVAEELGRVTARLVPRHDD